MLPERVLLRHPPFPACHDKALSIRCLDLNYPALLFLIFFFYYYIFFILPQNDHLLNYWQQFNKLFHMLVAGLIVHRLVRYTSSVLGGKSLRG